MKRIKIFISSVQSEFVDERQMLFKYLTTDVLLGMFFEPFVFENLPAIAQSAENQYLSEVEKSDIYLGIWGKEYGNADINGISPTEKEFNLSTKLNKTRLIYIKNSTSRNEKETALIRACSKRFMGYHKLLESARNSLNTMSFLLIRRIFESRKQ